MSFKKIISTAVISSALLIPSSINFATEAHWASDTANYLVENQLINADVKSIDFDEFITRAEFVSFINSTFGFSEKSDETFDDLNPSSKFYSDVLIAKKAGYINGYEDNTFKANQKLTREEAIVIISRVINLHSENFDNTKNFSDFNDISDWSKSSISASLKRGYLKGYEDNSLKIKSSITKAETMEFLKNIVGTIYTEEMSNSSEIVTIKGNLTVASKDVVLKNIIVEGDLIFTSAVEDSNIKLETVSVKGRTLIKNTETKLSLNNSDLSEVIVDEIAKEPKITLDSKSKVASINLKNKKTLSKEEVDTFVSLRKPEVKKTTSNSSSKSDDERDHRDYSKYKTVDVENKYLRKLINLTLDKNRAPDAEIKRYEMASLTELNDNILEYIKDDPTVSQSVYEFVYADGSFRGIYSIKGLEYATNLKILDLSENRISDLSPLRNLTQLESLDLDRNYISNLEPLKNLTNLKRLNIYNNEGIVDVKHLEKLSKLEWLDMHYCNRSKYPVDPSSLAKLKSLKYLSVESNFIENIDFLKELPNVTEFSCAVNHVTDLSPVSDLALIAYDDWSDDKFLNMYNQTYKGTINIDAPAEGMTYKFKNPIKGLDEYLKELEEMYSVKVPLLQVNGGSASDFCSASLNYNTNEIEITINKNDTKKLRSGDLTVALDCGMYCLTINFKISQDK